MAWTTTLSASMLPGNNGEKAVRPASTGASTKVRTFEHAGVGTAGFEKGADFRSASSRRVLRQALWNNRVRHTHAHAQALTTRGQRSQPMCGASRWGYVLLEMSVEPQRVMWKIMPAGLAGGTPCFAIISASSSSGTASDFARQYFDTCSRNIGELDGLCASHG